MSIEQFILDDITIFPFGRPGVGKGTLCKAASVILTQQHGYNTVHLESSKLLKDPKSPFFDQVQEIMAKGELVPVPIMAPLMTEAISRILVDPNVNGALVDGFPRNEEQAKALDEQMHDKPKIYLVVKAPAAIGVERILGRNEGRIDDNEETAWRRQEIYDNDTDPMIDGIKTRVITDPNALYCEIDGRQKKNDVLEEAMHVILETAKSGLHVARRRFMAGMLTDSKTFIMSSNPINIPLL
jgi:adenylate kinase family enzyme